MDGFYPSHFNPFHWSKECLVLYLQFKDPLGERGLICNILIQEKNSYSFVIYAVALLFAMFNVLDVRIAGFSWVWPFFDVMMVFYFAVFRRVFGVGFVFLLGFFSDALTGLPLGLTSLLYIILVRFFILANQRLVIKEDFLQIFYQFLAFFGLFLLLKWAFLSIFNDSSYDLTILVVQMLISGAFYVVMHRFFDYLNEKFS